MAHSQTDPAFPRPMSGDQLWRDDGSTGMTLLDWLAGMALQGIVAGTLASEPRSEIQTAYAAREAYAFAEAMIAERAS